MILVICISVYIIIGVLLNFMHPEMTEINPILRSVKRPSIDDHIKLGRYYPKWKRLIVVILIRVVLTVTGPAALLIDLIHKQSKRVMNHILRRYEEENYDYISFSLMKGAGVLSCMLCTYTTKLTGKITGGSNTDWHLKGYQCQSCGSFHEIEFADSLDHLPRCDCGGEISRNEIVFCPECRSNHLIYLEQYASEESNKTDIYRNLISPGNSVA